MFDTWGKLAYGLIRGTVNLPMRISFGSFFADRRGDKLAGYRIVRGKSGNYFVLMRGSEAAAVQVENVISCERRKVPLPLGVEFTHCLRLHGPPTDELRSVLGLLVDVVTIPVSEELSCALALDFYKDPGSSEDPMEWSNTPAGELVHQAKYHQSMPDAKALADAMAAVISKHPLFSSADLVVSVPGHANNPASFGVRLAKSVASRVGKDFVATEARSDERPPAKEAGHQDPNALKDEFHIPTPLTGMRVIIVDDVIRSAISMRAVAAAARRASAASVVGIGA